MTPKEKLIIDTSPIPPRKMLIHKFREIFQNTMHIYIVHIANAIFKSEHLLLRIVIRQLNPSSIEICYYAVDRESKL